MTFHVTKRAALLCVIGASAAVTGAAVAAGSSPAVPVQANLAITTSNVKVSACKTGFQATASATIHASSTDSRLRGTMRLKLHEVASKADDGYVRATGGLYQNGVKTGTVVLTGVDHGNYLNGMYVITLSNGRGMIFANTSSHQDTASTGHGELGADTPVAPSNSAVWVAASC